MASAGIDPRVKKPWYMHKLARMDQKARCVCPTEPLRGLGENIRSSDLCEKERIAIIAELDRMLREHSDSYEQSAIDYLRVLRGQVEQLPWYIVTLEQMATYAKEVLFRVGAMQMLVECGEDLKLSLMEEDDRESIVFELDRMLREDADQWQRNVVRYLELLRHQIAGDF